VNFDFSFACAAISNASSETSNETVSSTLSIEMIAGFMHFTPLMIPGIPGGVLPPDFSAEFLISLAHGGFTLGTVSCALQANSILSGSYIALWGKYGDGRQLDTVWGRNKIRCSDRRGLTESVGCCG
jgi:hypothetical protein